MDKARKALRFIAKSLVLKVVHRPIGIWLAWASLIYAAWALTPRLKTFFESSDMCLRAYSDVVVTWPVMIIGIITLIRRRLVARIFVSIIIAFMLVHAIYDLQILGICVGVLGFIGLLANRRWFYEKLPNLD